MTSVTLTIDRHERDVLRRELDLLTGTLEDLSNGVDRGERYHDLVGRARDGLHLLDDLGWAHCDPRQFFDVTLDRGRLAAWLAWQADQAEGSAADQAMTSEDCEQSARKYVQWGATETVAELTVEFAEDSRRAVDEALDLLTVASPQRPAGGVLMADAKLVHSPFDSQLACLPDAVPEGWVLVHNSVRPARRLGTRGFRAWLEDVDGGNPRRVLCGCDWAPELGPHYRINREGEES